MAFLRCLTCNKKGVEKVKSYYTATTSGGGISSVSRSQPMTSLKNGGSLGDQKSNRVVKKSESNGKIEGKRGINGCDNGSLSNEADGKIQESVLSETKMSNGEDVKPEDVEVNTSDVK